VAVHLSTPRGRLVSERVIVPLTILDASKRVPTQRGEVVLCIPVYGAHSEFVECIHSVLAHTPAGVPVLVSDDASPDDRSRRFLEELDEAGVVDRAVYYTRNAENRGFVATANDAFDRTAPADIVLVNSDCVLTDGAFDALKRAAYQNSLVATASVFTNNGTILSLPHRNRPQSNLPQTIDVESAAHAVARNSIRLHPRLPTVVGHCFYVKRAALELVGPFDTAFSPGYGEEVDFSQRCILHGLIHVVADDAFVLHKGSASFSVNGLPNPTKDRHDAMIAVRYPYYYDWIDQFSTEATSPFARSLSAGQRSLRGLRVSVDGRCLTPIVTGTQVHTLEVIAALSRSGGVRVRVAVPHDLGDYARAVLAVLENVEVLLADAVEAGTERDDIVHRPFQVTSHEDLSFLACLGERVVVTFQDLIAFNNPGYFSSFTAWDAHRQLSRHALARADRVVFFSHAAAEEAIAEELVERGRADVVYIGTDHTLDGVAAVEEPPSNMTKLAERPFLLCLGTDYVHKNRVFALRVLAALRQRHKWDGGLVFAGPHVPFGSSASDEASFLALHPDIAAVVVDVAAVDEGAKRWLLRHATMMIYPSVHEGFGLVPFEAADAGLACAFAAQTSLSELMHSSLALIKKWDPDETAEAIAPYLRSQALRAEHVASVRAAGASLTWKRTAHALIDAYTETARSPASEASKLVADFAEQQRTLESIEGELRRVTDLEQDYRDLQTVSSEMADELRQLRAAVPSDLEHALLAVSNRRILRGPIFGLLRTVYRTGYRLRHHGRAPAA
jgi:GT2 family glycosyltransferase/glycosyltransferase involved in cell wall biosynthesis